MLVRIAIFLIGLCATGLPAAAQQLPAAQPGKHIKVYKSPTCGCCAGWVSYLQDNGFDVTVHDQHDLSAIKAEHGITPGLQSCHTAIVDGYAIEGHVPVNDIWRLLAEKPAAVGLTAPGMPVMSPGMRSIEPRGYDVLLFDKDAQVSVYSRY
jgi:hypothetical protein